MLWPEYQASFANQIRRAQELIWKDQTRTPEENAEFGKTGRLHCGFSASVATGQTITNTLRVRDDFRSPNSETDSDRNSLYRASFWGVPQMMERLTRGIDRNLLMDIFMSQ